MSPPPSRGGVLPPNDYSNPGTHTTSVPNPDGSSNVYVHHISHGGPSQSAPPPTQMPQMFGIPYPMPMPTPPPPPMYAPYPAYPYPPPPLPSYGAPYYHQQHQQPTVIFLNQKEEKKEEKIPEKKPEKKPEPPKPEPPKPAPEPPKPAPVPVAQPPRLPPKRKGPQEFSKFSIASVIMFFLALVFGIVCVFKSYEAFDAREAGVGIEDDEYIVNRTIAMGTGAASTLCFTIAILGAFYAGMRHMSKSDGRKGHCCMGGFLMAGGVIFCLVFIIELIVLVLAFDSENVIYPEIIWSALIGSILSWMLMFGYSEMARRV